MTTPAPSAPNSAAPGYIPNATNTSRKLTPKARTSIRTCPGANSFAGHDANVKSSRVPAPPATNRQPELVSGNCRIGCGRSCASRAA
ncbi:Uncharacterised protein [Mycobacterium tuberculosis]|nr:Uncharacterised protein [Mycobacterium tuberculosis]